MAMAVVARTSPSLSIVRLETSSPGNGVPPPKPPPLPPARPLLSLSKPTWIVRTESNVRREREPPPVPSCVVCKGNGRVSCYNCNGKGRTNHMELAMLPKGEWPKWCRCCGGSGLAHCARCLGTGEYRYLMGFHFMNKDSDPSVDGRSYNRVADRAPSHSFTDLFLSNDQSDSGTEN